MISKEKVSELLLTLLDSEMLDDLLEIDEEMRSIINSCYEKTKKIITENKKLLSLIANTLLEEETITKEEIDYLVEHGHLPKNEEETSDKKESSKEETVKEKKVNKKEDTNKTK